MDKHDPRMVDLFRRFAERFGQHFDPRGWIPDEDEPLPIVIRDEKEDPAMYGWTLMPGARPGTATFWPAGMAPGDVDDEEWPDGGGWRMRDLTLDELEEMVRTGSWRKTEPSDPWPETRD
jgi:hypothetical protein